MHKPRHPSPAKAPIAPSRRKGRSPSQNSPSIGAKLVEGLTAMRDALGEGAPLEQRFTVRTAALPPEPKAWTPEEIKELRAALLASQGVFAGLLGASARTVQAWEQGQAVPAPMARRLLECIEREADYWRSKLAPTLPDRRAS